MADCTHAEALNLRHLRAWITAVEEGSVTGAARKLGVSQPALSQQLRALEDFFGIPLLERFASGVQPTPLGRDLLREARATMGAATQLLRRAKTAAGFEEGILEIVTLPTLVEGLLLKTIGRWQTLHNHFSIQIKEFPLQSALVEAVSLGDGDVAIGVLPPKWEGPVVELGWECFVLILPEGDPFLATDAPVRLSSMADRNWILYESSNGLADYVSAACAVAGFRPRLSVLTSQVHVAVNLAVTGLGVALVPTMNVPSSAWPNARHLSEPVGWKLAAFSRSSFGLPAVNFIELLKERDWPPMPDSFTVLPGN